MAVEVILGLRFMVQKDQMDLWLVFDLNACLLSNLGRKGGKWK